jgi:hypothetical protein
MEVIHRHVTDESNLKPASSTVQQKEKENKMSLPVMSLQFIVFATVRVQKSLIVHVDHQDPSAQLFVKMEGEKLISAHFYMNFGVTKVPAMMNNTWYSNNKITVQHYHIIRFVM